MGKAKKEVQAKADAGMDKAKAKAMVQAMVDAGMDKATIHASLKGSSYCKAIKAKAKAKAKAKTMVQAKAKATKAKAMVQAMVDAGMDKATIHASLRELYPCKPTEEKTSVKKPSTFMAWWDIFASWHNETFKEKRKVPMDSKGCTSGTATFFFVYLSLLSQGKKLPNSNTELGKLMQDMGKDVNNHGNLRKHFQIPFETYLKEKGIVI